MDQYAARDALLTLHRQFHNVKEGLLGLSRSKALHLIAGGLKIAPRTSWGRELYDTVKSWTPETLHVPKALRKKLRQAEPAPTSGYEPHYPWQALVEAALASEEEYAAALAKALGWMVAWTHDEPGHNTPPVQCLSDRYFAKGEIFPCLAAFKTRSKGLLDRELLRVLDGAQTFYHDGTERVLMVLDENEQ
jgi:hypothetical protein